MQRAFTTTLIWLSFLLTSAQVPQSIKYKAIARDGSGTVLKSQDITLQFTILQDNVATYQEQHRITTNKFGLISANIGEGTPALGEFNSIEWGVGEYSLKVELDPNGGTDFPVSGSDRLLSVPFALYAGETENRDDADADPTNEIQSLSLENNVLSLTTNGDPILIDLSSYLDNTDEQQISLEGTLLNISNGGSIDLSSICAGQYYYADRDGDGFGDGYLPVWVPSGIIPPSGFVPQDGDGDDNNAAIYPALDSEGNVYDVIQVGDQIWMAQNLRATRYADGTLIPHITDTDAWAALGDNDTDKAYCFYNNDESLGYGALYTFAAVVNGTPQTGWNRVQGVCPEGWHVPSSDEWRKLEDFLIAQGYNYDGTTSGDKLGKALASVEGWATSAEDGAVGNRPHTNNKSGFNGTPGGERNCNDSSFKAIGEAANWWESTVRSSETNTRLLRYHSNSFLYDDRHRSNGFSVRCVKDSNIDNDNDGYPSDMECNDNDATIYPGAAEVCGDGIDQDCNGSDLLCTDNDGDGFPEDIDCDDNNASRYPGAPEICDGIDNDCNGLVDQADVPLSMLCSPLPNAVTDCEGINGCVIVDCDYGWGDCDGDPANGCETSLHTIANCGECGNHCPDGHKCEQGNCVELEGAFTGTVAYYDRNDASACFYQASMIPEFYCAMNELQNQNNDLCGDCARIYGPKGAVVVKIVDTYPQSEGATYGSMDISRPAFDAITDFDGPQELTWEIVSCPQDYSDADGDGWIGEKDCDDTNQNINPEGIEILADGIDQDCDGADLIIPPFTLSTDYLDASCHTQYIITVTLAEPAETGGATINVSGPYEMLGSSRIINIAEGETQGVTGVYIDTYACNLINGSTATLRFSYLNYATELTVSVFD